jgi:23S rRNA (cytidine1920-2'-O)/16S rRNA (cytidine1409-2'-O)-methyltransferase
MVHEAEHGFVSRGGLKLQAALDAFGLDVNGFVCADLGCNVGGFTDCLLQRGARHVHAVDTGYGALAWKLRSDPRVTVMERTNALHLEPPVTGIDLVVIDLAWTKQSHAIPAALRWKPRRIITLIKPHYETSQTQRGILTDEQAAVVTAQVLADMTKLGVQVIADVASPIRGGAGKGKAGNMEHLAMVEPIEAGRGD